MAQPAQKVVPIGDQNEIRQVIEDFMDAMRSKDLARIMSYYAPDVVAYDMMPPLRIKGAEEYGKSWKMGLDMMQGPWTFEQRDLNIQVSGDLAVCHGLNHAAGTMSDGKSMDGWMRWTSVLRKLDGKWRIVHEHNSVPISADDKANWDLKP